MRKLPRVCYFHKKRFAECPEGCGHAFLVENRIQTVLARRRKKSAARAAAKSRSAKVRKEEATRAPKPCIQCGETVPPKWNRKFCSKRCSRQHWDSRRKPPPKVRELKVLYCAHCHQALPRVEGKNYFASAIYCSSHCRKEKRRERRKPPPDNTWRTKKVIAERKACIMCGEPVVPPRKSLCSSACGRKHSSRLQDIKEKEERKKLRESFQPEKRDCPRCGKEIVTSFEVPTRKFCSKRCAKNSARSTNRRNRLARGDTAGKVRQALSGRIRDALRRKGVVKTFTTLRYIGCTTACLRNHLQSQFTEGMSWSDYGVFGWHVDHIIPCAAFDLTREDHQMVCFNYRNLRPLWHHDNNKKGDAVDLDVLLAADLWVVQEARRLGVSL